MALNWLPGRVVPCRSLPNAGDFERKKIAELNFTFREFLVRRAVEWNGWRAIREMNAGYKTSVTLSIASQTENKFLSWPRSL
jgi:hypothetical protein